VLTITPSERAALQLLARGKTIDEIATCDVAHLLAKMGAVTAADAVAAAARRGLLERADNFIAHLPRDPQSPGTTEDPFGREHRNHTAPQ
jgi:hypothetical protein